MSDNREEFSDGCLSYDCPEKIPAHLRHRYTESDGSLTPPEELKRIEDFWKTQSFDPMRAAPKHWDGTPKQKNTPF